MAFCLTIEQKNKFKRALKDRTIDPIKLSQMTSAERRAFLEKYVGKENAQKTNALFESKLLLKNQKAGYIAWAKKVSGITPQVRKDIFSRIEKLDKVLSPSEENAFLEDLVSSRLRVDITAKEAKQISNLSNNMIESKKVWESTLNKNPDWSKNPIKTRKEWLTNTERLQYGLNKVALEKYINELKAEAKKISFREEPGKKLLEIATETIPGGFRSFLSTLDNSYWGRQGIVIFWDYKTNKLWTRNFLKSWNDIGRELIRSKRNIETLDLIKADIYSRPNALNGKYDAGDYGLKVLSEEEFPVTLPAKIPILGRLFKASEVAFNGGALRLRADVADLTIAVAEQNGQNTLDKVTAQGLGQMVSSMTGRGSNPLKLTGEQQKKANILIYSIKFFQSQVDTLTANIFDPKATTYTKTESAKRLLRIVSSIGLFLTLANLLNDEWVDEDPRSKNFGKIKIFGTWTDITGGLGQLATLPMRTIVPTKHNEQWGRWKKTTTGKWQNLSSSEFGATTTIDELINSLFLNKLSPVAQNIRAVIEGQFFGGDDISLKNFILNNLPISVQSSRDLLNNPNSEFIIGSMILEGMGFSIGTYFYKENWNNKTSKEMEQFKLKVGQQIFDEANTEFNKKYSDWFKEMTTNDFYNSLSDSEKEKVISNAKEKIKDDIFDTYDFKPSTNKKTPEEKKRDSELKQLEPKAQLPVTKVLANIFKKANKALVPDVYAAEDMYLKVGDKIYLSDIKPQKQEEIKKTIIEKFRDSIISIFNKLKPSEIISAVPEQAIPEYSKTFREIAVSVTPTSTIKKITSTPTPTPEQVYGRNPDTVSAIKTHVNSSRAISKWAKYYDVPYELMTDIAFSESSLDPHKQSSESTAGGLFQFIDTTWKETMRRIGKPLDTSKYDPDANAQATAFKLSKGELGAWDASKGNWGKFYTEEELKKYDKRLR